jgi:NaMN:DMB phosphoribosyltransferase
MGIGNTSPSAAMIAVFSGVPLAEIVGRGTDIDDNQLLYKTLMIEKALEINRPDAADPLDVLAKIGGFEIGGIAGLILGAAYLRKPVLVDGFISTAGALVAAGLPPGCAGFHDCFTPQHGKGASDCSRLFGEETAPRPGYETGRRDGRGLIDEPCGGGGAHPYGDGHLRGSFCLQGG